MNFALPANAVRYAMEVFAAAFDPAFRRDLYPVVEELQMKLGHVNDHANNRDRCLAWLDESTDESQRLVLSKVIALETAALQARMREFRIWWTPRPSCRFESAFLAGNRTR